MYNNFFFDRAEREYESRLLKEFPELEKIKENIKHANCKNTKEKKL